MEGGEDSHGNSFFTVLSWQDGNCPVFVFGMTENAIQMFLSLGVMSGVCSQDILEFCLDSFKWLRIELIHSWISKIFLAMLTNESGETNIDVP